MDHPTTSSLLTWMTFTPVLGVVLIFAVIGLRSLGTLSKQQGDEACRIVALVASAASTQVIARGDSCGSPP